MSRDTPTGKSADGHLDTFFGYAGLTPLHSLTKSKRDLHTLDIPLGFVQKRIDGERSITIALPHESIRVLVDHIAVNPEL